MSALTRGRVRTRRRRRRRPPWPVWLFLGMTVNAGAVCVFGLVHSARWWGAVISAGGFFLALDSWKMVRVFMGWRPVPGPRERGWEAELIVDACVIILGIILGNLAGWS